jgi:TIR domain
MSKIVISYRRSDSAATAGRIYDRLIDRYGEASVFMDVDKIPFGTDFRRHIQEVLSNADILLAVVGTRWLGAGADGAARIRDDADPVRVEIEAALRQGIAVIPVLVDGAAMPAAAELPEAIRDFAYLNAAPVDSGRDFRAHMERVIRSLDGLLASNDIPAAVADIPPPKRRRSRAAQISIPLALLIVAAIGFALVPQHWYRSAPPAPSPQQTSKPEPTSIPAKQTTSEPRPAPTPPPDKPAMTTLPPQTTTPPASPTPPPAATYRVLANVSGGGAEFAHRASGEIPAGGRHPCRRHRHHARWLP